MDKFDLEALKVALASGNIPLSDDEIRQLDGALRTPAQRFRARKVARAQDLNGQLARLEATKNFLAGLLDTEPLLYAFEAETALIIKRLSAAVQHAIDFLETEREQRKVRGDDPETTLFMDLRDVYVGRTGRMGISDDGGTPPVCNCVRQTYRPKYYLAPASVFEESAAAASKSARVFSAPARRSVTVCTHLKNTQSSEYSSDTP